MRLVYCFSLIAVGLSSCVWGTHPKKHPAITTDTLQYTYKIFKSRHPDCKSSSDSTCVFVELKYPVFNNYAALNDSITYKFLGMFSFVRCQCNNLEQFSKKFFSMYKNTPPRYHNKQVYNTIAGHAKVLRQDSSLTILQVDGKFTQMDRPLVFTYFINWDTKTNKIVTLNDLFTPGYENKVRNIGEVIFLQNEKLKDTSSFTKDYLFKYHKQRGFYLNNNYSVTPLGIRFFYNESEIKPRGAGTTDLFIPYDKIKSLLRPNTVITQYIK
jgi:hypothetical protein